MSLEIIKYVVLIYKINYNLFFEYIRNRTQKTEESQFLGNQLAYTKCLIILKTI